MGQDLIIFEQGGKLLTDSRIVAKAIEREHYNLVKTIREYCNNLTAVDFNVSEYFIESVYQDGTGRTLPCFQCTKKGCDMIANKLQGKKGIIFTAKYIEAFERMQEFIETGREYQNKISFKEQIEAVGAAADILKVNEASKVFMIGQHFKSYDLPTDFLPDYVSNGNRQYKPVTELLKENTVNLSAQKFNVLLVQNGYLEDRERKSTSSKTGKKKFKALTVKGLQYGENLINPKNQKEVQPQYYVDTFHELCQQVLQ